MHLPAWCCPFGALGPASTRFACPVFFFNVIIGLTSRCMFQHSPLIFHTRVRGTLEVGDVLSDISANPVRMRASGAEGWAHDGFFKSAQHVLQAVQPALRQAAQQFPGRPLLITGHSLGGALRLVLFFEQCCGRASSSHSRSVTLPAPWAAMPAVFISASSYVDHFTHFTSHPPTPIPTRHCPQLV